MGDVTTRGASATLMREVRCKDCVREVEAGTRDPDDVHFVYNEAWARGLVERGGSRSDRCREHRERHRTNIQGMPVAYVDLATVGEVADRTNPSGPLGRLGPLPGNHIPKPASVDLEQFGFGMHDGHVLEMLELLRERRVLVLKAGTGTGKSTFAPYRLLDPPAGASLRLSDFGPIVVTEPRVQATTGVATFVGCSLSGGGGVGPGFPVGYQVSGDRNHDEACQLVYVTDGTMINWLREGRLTRIGTVIVDEAHERSTNIDFILGFLNRELHRYPHLRVIIASATFNADFYREYFGGPDVASIYEVPAVKSIGYGFPLFPNLDVPLPDEMELVGEARRWRDEGLPLTLEDPLDPERFIRAHWRERLAPALTPEDVRDEEDVGWQEDLWETTRKLLALRFEDPLPMEDWRSRMPEVLADFVVDLVDGLDEAGIFGDILAFLPTSRTIEAACERIESELEGRADVYPLLSTLDARRKQDALAARRKGDPRKVVVSTNLAETSLTVEGVRFVVDSGLIAQSEWDPDLARGGIPTKAHSQAGIKQRWGRVGRKAPGWVFPLYTKRQYSELAEDTPPGSTRDNLEQLVMTAKMGGIDDVVGFPWPAAFEPTTTELDKAAEQARETFRRELVRADAALRMSGAVDSDGHPTPIGRELVRFQGLGSAASGLAILYADRLACVPEVVTILALLEDARLIGQDALLLSDYDWPDEWRVEAADRHRGIASLCEDDADLVLQICAAWERADMKSPPWEPSQRRRDWARRWWVSNDVLLEAANARREIMALLSPAMKEEVKRFVEPALLRRARGVITRAFPSLQYEQCRDRTYRPVGEHDETLAGGELEVAALENDSLFDVPPRRVVALRRRVARSEERFISSLVAVEDWALEVAGAASAGDAADAMRLLVAAAIHAEADAGRDVVTQLLESWPVGQRMRLTLTESAPGGRLADVSEVIAPFARPLTVEEEHEERQFARANAKARRASQRRTTDADEELTATAADSSGELDTRRSARERIADEVERDAAAFEAAEFREVETLACGECAACRVGNEHRCENRRMPRPEESETEDPLRDWLRTAVDGVDLSRPPIAVAGEPVEDDGWYEVVGYRSDDGPGPVVVVRPDWRPARYDGNPAHHHDVQAGETVDVIVGPLVRDHSEWLRSFVRTDGLGRFILREAHPDPRAQEQRGEIAASLYRRHRGLLAELVEGETLTATVVPARTKGCFTITLLELLHQHLQSARPGEGMEFQELSRGRRGSYYTGVVEAAANERGFLRVRLLHEDKARGIRHRFELSLDGDSADGDSADGHPDADAGALGTTSASPDPALGREGNPVLLRVERDNALLDVRGKEIAALEEIVGETDRQLRILGIDEIPQALGGPAERDRGIAGPSARLRSERDTPVPRATAAALAALDDAAAWHNDVWAFWARSHHLRPVRNAPLRQGERAEPCDVRAAVTINEETPREQKRKLFEEFAAAYPIGSVVEGTVQSIVDFGAFAEVAPGVRGLIHVSELAWTRVEHPASVVSEGQPVRVLVLELDHAAASLKLSMKQLQPHPFDVFAARAEIGDVVKGPVSSLTSFGAFVEVAPGVEGMAHVSELAWSRVERPSDVLAEGDHVSAEIIGVDSDKRELRLSIKRTQPHPFDEFVTRARVGDRLSGRVVKITGFGAFVEVADGVEGLVHVSEMAWSRVERPEDVLAEDAVVPVEIIDFDMERQSLKLSIKRTQPHPFDVFVAGVRTGDVLDGHVTKVMDFGAFVEVAEGVEGLVHVSELAWERVDHPSDAIAQGEAVRVEVIGIDHGKRALKLSTKRLEPHPFDRFASAYRIGDVISGSVVSLKEFGAFVRVAPGVEGLVHISQLAPYRVAQVSDVVGVGQVVNVRIVQIDQANRRLGLSMRF